MYDCIAQLCQSLLQVLIGCFRNLLRKPLGKILPILFREDRLEGRQSIVSGPNYPESIRLGVTARVSHALHEIGIEQTGGGLYLIMIGDMDLISLVRCKGREIWLAQVQQRRRDLGLIDHQPRKLRGIWFSLFCLIQIKDYKLVNRIQSTVQPLKAYGGGELPIQSHTQWDIVEIDDPLEDQL